MNYITILILNTYADENYGSTAQKWKGIILPDRSGAADDCHTSILVAQTGGKQDLLKSLDISIYQIPTHSNTPQKYLRNFHASEGFLESLWEEDPFDSEEWKGRTNSNPYFRFDSTRLDSISALNFDFLTSYYPNASERRRGPIVNFRLMLRIAWI